MITFRSCIIGLSCCQNEVTAGACSCRKDVSNISANFSKCDGVCFHKRIISKTGECVLEKNSATIVFLYCYIATVISSKLWKFPVHSLIRRDFSFSAFPFIDQEKFFLFLWLFLMKDAVVEHSHIMWESDASDLFKKLLNMSGKYINNSFH